VATRNAQNLTSNELPNPTYIINWLSKSADKNLQRSELKKISKMQQLFYPSTKSVDKTLQQATIA
jgi:hypothetical protein